MRTEYEIIVKSINGESLACIVSEPNNIQPSRDCIICLHGFNSGKNSKTNRKFIEKVRNDNFLVVRFDFQGHYDSTGDIKKITVSKGTEDLHSIILYIKNKYQINRIGLFATSYGGNVAFWYASMKGGIAFLALKAPIADYIEVRKNQLGSEGINQWESKGEIVIPDGSNVISDFNFLVDLKTKDTYLLANLISIPVLIVHGTMDDNVPIEQSIKINNILNNCILLKIEGANHGFKGEGELDQVIDSSYKFIKEVL